MDYIPPNRNIITEAEWESCGGKKSDGGPCYSAPVLGREPQSKLGEKTNTWGNTRVLSVNIK